MKGIASLALPSTLLAWLAFLPCAPGAFAYSTRAEESLPRKGALILDIHDPRILEALESRGYSLAALSGAGSLASNQELFEQPAQALYPQFARIVAKDVADLRSTLAADHVPTTLGVTDGTDR